MDNIQKVLENISITVSVNTVQVEVLGDFFKYPGEKGLIASKKMAKKVLKNPARSRDFTADIASAVFSAKPKAALSTKPELINFYHTGNGL